ncbi:peptidase domain-containing ABC transporter [Luteibaculum oceani]|uniref:ATP-binding cassette domain-containing protein n=1 Tax=Luteibaculum oceani TaxID=1294296 RepID=A0A5C6UTX1_9FLAO|nr:ATP-binding cassette domain-containing protein [Luteibaculum oceani]TXC76074.1 ATP-binding cassette domain-containing protein [Luteibaculum oceani]
MENKEQLTPVQRFWRLLKPDRKEIRNVYLIAMITGLVNLSLPLGIQAIINFIQGGAVSTAWIVLVVLVVLGIAIVGALQIAQMRITENLQQKIFTRAAFDFGYRLPHIKMEALYDKYAPELMNRFFDVMSVQKGLSKMLIDFSAAALQVFFGLLLLSLYHPFFILFSVALILLVYAIFRFTAKKGLDTSLSESKRKYEVAHWLEELARANITFKLAGKSNLALHRIDHSTEKYLDERENHFKVLVQQYAFMVLFKVIVATGLLAIGGALVIEQEMNIGQFVAAEIVILLIMSAVEKLIVNLEVIYDILTSLEKIGQVTDLELEDSTGTHVGIEDFSTPIAVTTDKLTFTYPNQPKNVLDQISFKINKGDRVFITGASDSGKSTLLYLMGGLYQPTGGFIAYDDIPMGNLNPESLRDKIGNCLEQEKIFQGTIEENISLGRPGITLDDVINAVEICGLKKFVRQTKEGYNTVLSPEGRSLSRGQTQKLMLARAIVTKPTLLILENAFNAIDYEDKIRVMDRICDPKMPWTLVAVSADPDLYKRCNKVLTLEHGKVDSMIEKGGGNA